MGPPGGIVRLMRCAALRHVHMRDFFAVARKHHHCGDIGCVLGDFVQVFRQEDQHRVVRMAFWQRSHEPDKYLAMERVQIPCPAITCLAIALFSREKAIALSRNHRGRERSHMREFIMGQDRPVCQALSGSPASWAIRLNSSRMKANLNAK
jgi:hypothetical protein